MLISQDLPRNRNLLVCLAVVVSVFLHLMLLYGVTNLGGHSRPPVEIGPELILHLLPAPPRSPATPAQPLQAAPKISPQAENVTGRRLPSPATTSDETATTVKIPAAASAPSFTPPMPSTSTARPASMDMIEAAKRNVGQIDQELRKAQPPSREPIPPVPAPTAQQKLERGIAASARPRETTMEDFTRPDGQRVTKVSGPFGTYCVTQISVGNTKGEDIMQRGAMSRTTNCGTEF